MRPEYEQMELDTRKELDIAIERLVADSIREAGEMIGACGESRSAVRNRHEAYGISAERLARITKAAKDIKGDVSTLLGTLPDPNFPAIEAVSSIANSLQAGAAVMVEAAAEMQRVLRDLYDAETREPELTPMERLAEESAAQYFQDAEDIDDEEEE